jgi:glycopeptide antibiotics resistance protein
MGLQGIALYTLRASAFAAAVTLAYALTLRTRGKPLAAGRLTSVFYFAALIEITVLRGGVDWDGFLSAARVPYNLMPFRTTMGEFRLGVWPFVYHAVGNLAWFVPVGIILRRKPIWMAFLCGGLLSAVIEGLQWALMTGMTDVDDVILNSCGALIGWLIARAFPAAGIRRVKMGGDT